MLTVSLDADKLSQILTNLLAPAYEVLEAADGQQALDLLVRESVDLVASDAMMPHVSGLELLQQLKANPTLQGLPFLMITAWADEAHRLTALATGVDDYLLKPFEAPELLAWVGRCWPTGPCASITPPSRLRRPPRCLALPRSPLLPQLPYYPKRQRS
jgi:DNA-binding response OmpR family regulator